MKPSANIDPDSVRKTTASGRFYYIETDDDPPVTKEYPSVTSVLGVIMKPALIRWAENTATASVKDAAADLYADIKDSEPMSRVAFVASLDRRLGRIKQTQRETNKALEIGKQTHNLIEWTLKRQLGQIVGPRPETTPPAEWAVMAFEDWAQSVNMRPLMIEQVVWSHTYEYAGTMDLLAEVNGKRTLIDFKTSRGIYPEYELQAAAYEHALTEMGHGPLDGGSMIVRLPKLESDPAFEVHQCPHVATSLPIFVTARQLWTWWHRVEEQGKAAWKAKKDKASAVAAVV